MLSHFLFYAFKPLNIDFEINKKDTLVSVSFCGWNVPRSQEQDYSQVERA